MWLSCEIQKFTMWAIWKLVNFSVKGKAVLAQGMKASEGAELRPSSTLPNPRHHVKPRGKNPQNSLNRRLGNLQRQSGRFGGEINLFTFARKRTIFHLTFQPIALLLRRLCSHCLGRWYMQIPLSFESTTYQLTPVRKNSSNC